MKRSMLVIGLAGLALATGGCSAKAKAGADKDAVKAGATAAKPNPWSSDAAIDAAKAEQDAKAKKKPAPAAPAAKASPNPWASDSVIEAAAAAEAEKAAKAKQKKK